MDEFLPIPGFPGYDISRSGEVRCWIFRGDAVTTPRPQVPYWSSSNRWAIKLYQEATDGTRRRTTASLAILILSTFQGNPASGEQREVDFVDGNPHNIQLENLRWRKIP